MEGNLRMKDNFQQPVEQVELDEQELEQITGGCHTSHKPNKHVPPPPPHNNKPAPHPAQPPLPLRPGQPGFPFGKNNGKC
jgi:hypothetical protein